MKSIKRVLSFMGLVVIKKSNMSTLEGFLLRVKQNGILINTVYDIGAYQGEWAKQVQKILGRRTNFILFEPNKEHNALLKKSGFLFYNYLLSAKRGIMKFYSLGGTGDSYFKEHNPAYDSIAPKMLMADTLDAIIAKEKLELPDLIKLDTQGSEVDILTGAVTALASAKIVILEVPIVEYNIGAPNFVDYINFMRNNGFIGVDVTEIHVLLSRLVQIDIAFVRQDLLDTSYIKWHS